VTPGSASSAQPPASPRQRRWWRFALIILAWGAATAALVLLGVAVRDAAVVSRFDRHVTTVVVEHRTATLDAPMRVVTWFGSWVALVAGFAVVVALVVRGRLPSFALAFVVIVGTGEELAVQLAKHAVRRPRPPPDLWVVRAHGWSFPSGHTATAFAVYLTLALLVSRTTARRGLRLAAWLSALALGLAVATSRVELGVHWTTDVVTSALVAAGWLGAVVALIGPPGAARTVPNRPSVGPPAEIATKDPGDRDLRTPEVIADAARMVTGHDPGQGGRPDAHPA